MPIPCKKKIKTNISLKDIRPTKPDFLEGKIDCNLVAKNNFSGLTEF